MSDEKENGRKRPRSKKREEIPFKGSTSTTVRGVQPSNLPLDEAKVAMEKAYEDNYSHTQPAHRLAAQLPSFLNVIKEMYREREIQPKKLTPEVLEEVIERLWTGESLSAICQDDHIPSYKNLMKWMEVHPDVEQMIEKAKMRGTHALVDCAMDIMNGGPLSTGDKVRDGEIVKLIKWIIGKRHHSYYGDQIKVTHESTQKVFVLPEEIIQGQLVDDSPIEDDENEDSE